MICLLLKMNLEGRMFSNIFQTINFTLLGISKDHQDSAPSEELEVSADKQLNYKHSLYRRRYRPEPMDPKEPSKKVVCVFPSTYTKRTAHFFTFTGARPMSKYPPNLKKHSM